MFFESFRFFILTLLGILTAVAVFGGSLMWTVSGPAFCALFARIVTDIRSTR